MKIKITTNGNVIKATLNNSEAAKDFASFLPLTLNLDDYGQSSKIKHLDKPLKTGESPSGFNPKAGDIIYFAPWGNLSIFYKDFGYASELVKLGKIEGDISILKTSEELKATIEIVK
ncbi:cyclophilin-like fold protein [Maribellus maritimus]|uniref:cyclophilin-like fold protein n=1 Tax=Maribellus maritimus TaxID=2870838 RepID=UPI001EE9BDBA|nr:cyclophilin-like fold protein [Maribellus maritimus]MCG6189500.1 hypothetical protein [Maribellus maritimus]